MTNLAPVCLRSLPDMMAWLTALVAQERPDLRLPIDRGTPFADLGLDSMSAITLTGAIEAALDIELPPTLLWDHPDIAELARFLVARLATSDAV